MQFTFATNIFLVRLDYLILSKNSGSGRPRMIGGATPRQDWPCCIDLAAGPRRGCGGMADAADSKSASRKGVGVQVPSPAPNHRMQIDGAHAPSIALQTPFKDRFWAPIGVDANTKGPDLPDRCDI